VLYAGWEIYRERADPSRVFSDWDSGERFFFLQVWPTLYALGPFGTDSQVGLHLRGLRTGELITLIHLAINYHLNLGYRWTNWRTFWTTRTSTVPTTKQRGNYERLKKAAWKSLPGMN
jgi:hypothetical protein